MAKKKKRERALIIDGNNYCFRAHYACPPMTTKKGFPTSVISGFFSILIADIWTLRPTRVMVVFDARGGTDPRRAIFADYKQNRSTGDPAAREAVYTQIPMLKKILKSIGVRVVCKRGCEGDDAMGALAVKFEREGFHAILATSDKDLAQVVGPNISRLCPKTRKLLGVEATIAKFGVPPELIVDALMLVGDKVDCIPGVHKCGWGTASKWLKKYGSVENTVKHASELTPALRANLLKVKKLFKVTRQLATIDTEIELTTSESNTDFRISNADEKEFEALCKKLEFTKTAKDIRSTFLRNK